SVPRDGVDPAHSVRVHAPARELVRLGRVAVAIAEYERSGGDERAEHLPDVLSPVGFVEQPLGHRIEARGGRIEQDFPDLLPDRGASGLARQHGPAAGPLEALGAEPRLRALARALDAFECDQGHRGRSLARLRATARPLTLPPFGRIQNMAA